MTERAATDERAGSADGSSHPDEPHRGWLGSRLNWLRAGVLGANDGIVSTAGIVVGVAGASSGSAPVLVAGVAAVVAGALSMGGGEYVSVSTQADTQSAVIAKEKNELATMPDVELEELAGMYRQRGLSPHLAHQVAVELTAGDALAAHAEVELGIDPYERTSAWQAAFSSMLAFVLGAALPLLAISLPPLSARIPVTMVAVALALALTGWASARLGEAPALPAVARNVVVGLLAMVVTYAIGTLVGGAV